MHYYAHRMLGNVEKFAVGSPYKGRTLGRIQTLWTSWFHTREQQICCTVKKIFFFHNYLHFSNYIIIIIWNIPYQLFLHLCNKYTSLLKRSIYSFIICAFLFKVKSSSFINLKEHFCHILYMHDVAGRNLCFRQRCKRHTTAGCAKI